MPATQLTDNGDGSYTVAYQTTVRGRLQVYVSLNGRDLPDSPFEVVSDTKVRRGLAQKMLADRRLTREKRDVSGLEAFWTTSWFAMLMWPLGLGRGRVYVL